MFRQPPKTKRFSVRKESFPKRLIPFSSLPAAQKRLFQSLRARDPSQWQLETTPPPSPVSLASFEADQTVWGPTIPLVDEINLNLDNNSSLSMETTPYRSISDECLREDDNDGAGANDNEEISPEIPSLSQSTPLIIQQNPLLVVPPISTGGVHINSPISTGFIGTPASAGDLTLLISSGTIFPSISTEETSFPASTSNMRGPISTGTTRQSSIGLHGQPRITPSQAHKILYLIRKRFAYNLIRL
jgi:hypothetical protein